MSTVADYLAFALALLAGGQGLKSVRSTREMREQAAGWRRAREARSEVRARPAGISLVAQLAHVVTVAWGEGSQPGGAAVVRGEPVAEALHHAGT